ncbi:MAG: OB-fold domain-containing protein, partial [Phycisphaerae bacterium]
MIVRIRGTLSEVGDDAIILDRDGLGYEILVPRFALQ